MRSLDDYGKVDLIEDDDVDAKDVQPNHEYEEINDHPPEQNKIKKVFFLKKSSQIYSIFNILVSIFFTYSDL